MDEKKEIGVIFNSLISKKLLSLSSEKNLHVHEYLVTLIEKEYSDYVDKKLFWDYDND